MSSPSYYIRTRVHSLPSFNSLLQSPPPLPPWPYVPHSQSYRMQHVLDDMAPGWDQDDRDMAAAASLLDLQSAGHSDSDSPQASESSSQSARTSSPMSQTQMSTSEDGFVRDQRGTDEVSVRKRLRPSRSTPLPARATARSSHDREKKKPRWNTSERTKLFMAIIKDKGLDNMASYNWERIACSVGRARKACKDQWRREVLPALIHNLKTDLFQ